MENMTEIIKNFIKDANLNMSGFQINNFIINEQITDYKKIKQILLELRLRYDQLTDHIDEKELKDNNIKIRELEIDNIRSKKQFISDKDKEYYEIKNIEIEIKKLKRQIEANNQTLTILNNEIQTFENYFIFLVEKNGMDKIEDFIYNQEDHEPEYWVNRFIRNASFELTSTGRISTGLMETISTLDENAQKLIYKNSFEQYSGIQKTFEHLQITNVMEKEKGLLQ